MYLDGRARFKISKIEIPEMKERDYCVYKEGFHPLIRCETGRGEAEVE